MPDQGRPFVAFVAVGSNIEPRRNIVDALKALVLKTEVIASSTFYRTAPIGRTDQPMFINGIWLIRTPLGPAQVRDELLRPTENQLDRRRTTDKFAPRTIDLDLILYDDWVRSDTDVTLPHPDIQRPFVWIPIRELLCQDKSPIDAELSDRMAALLPAAEADAPFGTVEGELTQRLWQLIEQEKRISFR